LNAMSGAGMVVWALSLSALSGLKLPVQQVFADLKPVVRVGRGNESPLPAGM
jgi:hypothetical protein